MKILIYAFAFLFLIASTSAYYCSQESANVSVCNSTGLGSYLWDSGYPSNWWQPEKMIDESYGTYGYFNQELSDGGHFYVNYTKPSILNYSINKSYWSVRVPTDYTSPWIPMDCLNATNTTLSLRINFNTKIGAVALQCRNATAWNNMGYNYSSPDHLASLSEEAVVWWLLDNPASNPITIIDPVGAYSSLTIPISLSYNQTIVDKCWFNVTRGLAHTVEVANTFIANCNVTNTSSTLVSSYNTNYDFNLCINHTDTTMNCTSSSFFVNSLSTGFIAGGPGGGGFNPNQEITNSTYIPNLENSLFGYLSSTAFIINGYNITYFVIGSLAIVIFIILYSVTHKGGIGTKR